MVKMLMSMLTMVRNEKGQGMVEYGLILALIVVGAVAFLPNIGTKIAAAFNTVSTALGN